MLKLPMLMFYAKAGTLNKKFIDSWSEIEVNYWNGSTSIVKLNSTISQIFDNTVHALFSTVRCYG